jgi:hypothetical protein
MIYEDQLEQEVNNLKELYKQFKWKKSSHGLSDKLFSFWHEYYESIGATYVYDQKWLNSNIRGKTGKSFKDWCFKKIAETRVQLS